jgi:hypothetical protein
MLPHPQYDTKENHHSNLHAGVQSPTMGSLAAEWKAVGGAAAAVVSPSTLTPAESTMRFKRQAANRFEDKLRERLGTNSTKSPSTLDTAASAVPKLMLERKFLTAPRVDLIYMVYGGAMWHS